MSHAIDNVTIGRIVHETGSIDLPEQTANLFYLQV
jgi:hypothetical protein